MPIPHLIISLNTDRRVDLISKIRQLIESDVRAWPSVICLQDVSNSVNLVSSLEWMFDDKYEIISSPLLRSEQHRGRADNNSSEHIIMLLKGVAIIMGQTFIMDNNEYRSSGATALGAAIALNCQPCNYDVIDKDREWIDIFSVYVRPSARDDDLTKLFNWLKDRSNMDSRGLSRTIIVGDFNAINPLWNSIAAYNSNREMSVKHYLNIRENRGRQIHCFIRNNKLECLNKVKKEPTFNSVCIDLCLAGRKIANRVLRVPLKLMQVGSRSNCHRALVVTYTMHPGKQPTNNLNASNTIILPKRRHDNTRQVDGDQTSRGHDGTDRVRILVRYDTPLINNQMFDFFKEECNSITRNWNRVDRKRNAYSLIRLQ